MSATMKVSAPPLAVKAPRTTGRKRIILWVALFVVIGVAGMTLAFTVGRTEAPARQIAPAQTALQRHHEEANTSSTSSSEGAERQAALKQLKDEAAAGAAPVQMGESQDALKRLKEGY